MSKEREMLKRILTDNDDENYYIGCKVYNEIKELLAQPEQANEPVATKLEGHHFTAFHVSADDFKKLQKLPTGTKIYTAPPIRKPLSDRAVRKFADINYFICNDAFIKGVKWAEHQHGIGVDDE